MTRRASGLIAAILAAASLALPLGALFSNDKATDEEVTITFANTLAVPVDIYCLGPTDAEELYVSQFPADHECVQKGRPGNVWRIKSENKVVAEYETLAAAEQRVDLGDVVAWQLPVALVIRNTSSGQVDVLWEDAEGNGIEQSRGLREGKQYEVSTYPGAIWLIQADGQVVAEYVVGDEGRQIVDVETLKDAYTSTNVVVFQNTTEYPVSIAWMHMDGHEIEYVADLPPGEQHTQEVYPNQPWTIRSQGKLLVTYIPDDVLEQVVDINYIATEGRSLATADVDVDDDTPRAPPPRASSTTSPRPPPPRRN